MRISDWSSDVCSSDLQGVRPRIAPDAGVDQPDIPARLTHRQRMDRKPVQVGEVKQLDQPHRVFGKEIVAGCCKLSPVQHEAVELLGRAADRRQARSEEHTSELQSLMRISYAVFCLKKKN